MADEVKGDGIDGAVEKATRHHNSIEEADGKHQSQQIGWVSNEEGSIREAEGET